MSTGSKVLVIANEDVIVEAILIGPLRAHGVVIARTPAEAKWLLDEQRFPLVIATNFGLGLPGVLGIIPDTRDYPVLCLTGVIDSTIKRTCAQKKIHYRTLPIEIPSLLRELRIALDDPQTASE